MNDDSVRAQARKAGIAIDWIDANDRPQRVSTAALERILAALDFNEDHRPPRLITTTTDESTPLPDLRQRTSAELILEDGSKLSFKLEPGRGLPPITIPGYHELRYGDRQATVAVAPPRCLTLADVLDNRKSWGLAVQLYGLRHPGDGGIGDTAALGALARQSQTSALTPSPSAPRTVCFRTILRTMDRMLRPTAVPQSSACRSSSSARAGARRGPRSAR